MFVYDENLKLYGDAHFLEFENTHKVTLPDAYKVLMRTYGAGLYNDFLQVFPIENIVSRTEEAINIWKEYPEFYWPQSNSIISFENSQRCFALADTIDGDIVGYDPKTKTLITFPRHDDLTFIVHDDFSDFVFKAVEYFGMQSSSLLTFSPLHDKKTKRLILQRKQRWFSSKSNTQENISSHAVKLETLHQSGQVLRVSEETFEILYSKRWAARLQLSKFSTVHGDRLSIQISNNPRYASIIDKDIDEVFLSDYKVILSE